MDRSPFYKTDWLRGGMTWARKRGTLGAVLLLLSLLPAGCGPMGSGGGGVGEGPGHRKQPLALTPLQELQLGRKAYAEILSKAGNKVLPQSDERVVRVRHVGEKILKAAQIEPLQAEINLNLRSYYFEPAFNVIEDRQVNAFCLPGCKICVFSGLLNVADKGHDDYLATVLGHEVAHALAHHASERIARAQMYEKAVGASGGSFGKLDPHERGQLIGLLGGGVEELYSRAYDRKQESEADHIGLFLMTFAGYDPHKALEFWQRMMQLSAQQPRPPVILSDHPSDAQRIRQIQAWIPQAEGAYQAYNEGNIVKKSPR
jgi:metalloendopeptidase OMA1, mitochondrial